MSRAIKLLVATIAIALAATITGLIAYDQGRDARQDGTVRYELSLDRKSPVVTGSARGVNVQPRPYRLRLTPNTVIRLGPGPNCQPLTWQATGTGTGAR